MRRRCIRKRSSRSTGSPSILAAWLQFSDMTFDVRKGEIVGLIGPNGAGKTTAFNVMTGFQQPSSGEVRYQSRVLTGIKPHEIAKWGLVRTFQRTSVFQERSVFQNVLTGLHCSGRSGLWDTMLRTGREKASERELESAAHEVLRFVGLEQRAGEPAGTLSYGEQRLVGIALALAVKPTMLLLDEPVSGMNHSETARTIELVEKISAAGMTILLVEHDSADGDAGLPSHRRAGITAASLLRVPRSKSRTILK